MEPNKHPKTALTWAPEGRRSRGRPKDTWRRTAEKQRTALGFGSWNEATVAARDSVTLRRRGSGPIPTQGHDENLKSNLLCELLSPACVILKRAA